MKVLVIGSGGREHAMVWKLIKSTRVKKVFAAPGNGGISELAECLPLGVEKVVDLADFAASSPIDLTVVGPEVPLVHGMVDYFRQRKLPIFGPTKAASRLEGSKIFAKQLMQRYNVPTARFQIFQDLSEALNQLKNSPMPVVVKADGLAGGKGAIVAESREEAIQAVTGMLREHLLGEAGNQVIIEECLQGEEVSVLALVDGSNFILLEPSQDHKRALDGDQGPNTGGMGAYSPVPMASPDLLEEIRSKIFEPIVVGMANEGCPFQGILYAGLMLTAQGPKVLEFNVRFGDPEAQAILPRLKTDFFELLLASMEGRLGEVQLTWDPRACACLVLASQGYPGKYDLGREITGVKEAAELPDTLIFHAGTKREGSRLLTTGGRVLNVAALGETLEEALKKVYQAADRIQFEGRQFRRDIGARALRHAASR